MKFTQASISNYCDVVKCSDTFKISIIKKNILQTFMLAISDTKLKMFFNCIVLGKRNDNNSESRDKCFISITLNS